MQFYYPNVLVLNHLQSQATEKNKDVTSLEWNREGTLLATGHCDGQARIWNRSGELVSTFNKHEGPIISLKWNKKGNYLISKSIDTTVVVWNVKSGEPKQQFDFHSGPLLDVAWRNCNSLATISVDKMIYVCNVGVTTQSKHSQDIRMKSILSSGIPQVPFWHLALMIPQLRKPVYAIAFSPNGEYLTSGSLDKCMNIWSVKEATIVRTYNGDSGIFYVCWNKEGTKVASCFANNKVCVFDIRM